jgi:hypothetical protein
MFSLSNALALGSTTLGGFAYDSDAASFFSREAAAGYTLSASEKTAVNNFISALKTASVYSKIYEMFLLIGGTSATHALGFKGVKDITFVGSPTHNSSGVTTNGTTQYGDTGILNSAFGATPFIAAYGSIPAGGLVYLMGSYGAGAQINYLSTSGTNTVIYNIFNEDAGNASAGTDTPRNGFKAGSKLTATTIAYQGNSLAETKTVLSATGSPSGAHTLPFGAVRNQATGAVTDFNASTYKLIMAGNGASAADLATIKSATVTLQTALGRA